MIMFPPNSCGFQERRWPLGEARDEMEKEVGKSLHKEKRMSSFLSFSAPLKYMFF